MKKLWYVFFVVILLTVPVLGHSLKKSTYIEAIMIDTSSADERYTQRQGIYEMLKWAKIENETGNSYEANRDYTGIKVVEAQNIVEYNDLPMRLDQVDLIYLTDVHGVVENQLAWGEKDSHKLLYGGLQKQEWRKIKNRLDLAAPSTFIVEYNSFSNSTESTVQQQLAQQLGIQQTGYEARVVDDLSTMLEGEAGTGLVIRDKASGQLTVLKSIQEVRFKPTEQGASLLGEEPLEPFTEWFDLALEDEAQPLAYAELDVSEDEAQQLAALGLPKRFVAATHITRDASEHYYFAGKFSYQHKKPWPVPYMLGYVKLHQLVAKDDAFYWKHYMPMMAQILADMEHKEVQADKPIDLTPVQVEGISYNARIIGDKYEVLQDGEWKGITIKGVNIGMAKPGTFPGEAGIKKEDYVNWLRAIGEMNANVIRVYTVHPPAFYEALYEYNTTHKQPIYVFHGVWAEEEPMEEHLDVYGEATEKFHIEIKKIVDILHGNAEIEQQPGHAYGKYTKDVSPYVIGWMLGIEWYPYTVENVNKLYTGKAQFDGTYFSTKDAMPFEIWLAEQMEFTAQYEAENYQWTRPFSFTNWVTTDLLEHPYEPSEQEDLVGVNPNVIYEKGIMQDVGQFANYHVYPYYPDFLNFTPTYVNYIDHRGEKNNYAGYLHDLKQAHRLPIVISEFGIPGSRGLTHKNPFGWNQGFMSEKAQGEILTRLYEDILQEGMLGGIVFSWQDEWFKRTWNTMDLDNPDQRPFWSNAQTNEQQFGLLSFDTLKIKVDGDTTDWFGQSPFYETEHMSMYVNSDERYLYVRLDIEDVQFTDNYYPLIYFDTLANHGNHTYGKHSLQAGAEFALILKDEQRSRLEVDAYYDVFQKLYGDRLKLVPFEGTKEKNSGQFLPLNYALNKQLTIPILDQTFPFESYETGKLRKGNGNPNSEQYDSLADYYTNEKDGVVEIRIPWLLLNVADPSKLEVWSDLYAGDDMQRETIAGIQIGALLIEQEQVKVELPGVDSELETFVWESWVLPAYKERLKESYYIIQESFQGVE